MARTAALATQDFALVFSLIKPDIVVVVADRFECLPLSIAAIYQNIHLVHVEGGEVSGSVDESIRHAITKLSHVHLTCSQEAKERVISLGEDPRHVHNVGSTSMDVIAGLDLCDLAPVMQAQHDFGFGGFVDLKPREYLLVVQHPVTTEFDDAEADIQETVAAVLEMAMPTIWVQPNMDAGEESINKALRIFGKDAGSNNVHFFKGLQIELYAPLMKNAACIIGNSSSGIREGGFLGTPSVNIGTRQNGRERPPSVMDVPNKRDDICDAIRKQLAKVEYERSSIYGDGKTSARIVSLLLDQLPPIQKRITY